MPSRDAPLPDLPDPAGPELLRALDDAGLDEIVAGVRSAERITLEAMAPYDARLKELRARLAEIATERRRRERAEATARRRGVREAAATGVMGSLADALASPPEGLPAELPLAELRVFLKTGGEARLGFPGRPGPTAFTDGRSTQTAVTWGDACRLYAGGWEPGTPQVAGVRVHLAGTRVERVAAPDEILVEPTAQSTVKSQ